MTGFSLIEISLALAVVGVLAVGAFKGYELLQQARLQRLASQLTSLRMTVSLFQERFGALPGDWYEAEALYGLKNGDGDGLLQGDPLQAWSEPSLFWYHLVRTNLITGLSFFKGEKASPEKGVFVPKTSLGAGMFALSAPTGLPAGVWVLLAAPYDPRKASLTPAEAHSLDKKLSNGDPLSGDLQSRNEEGSSAECIKDGRYLLEKKRPACLVYFALNA